MLQEPVFNSLRFDHFSFHQVWSGPSRSGNRLESACSGSRVSSLWRRASPAFATIAPQAAAKAATTAGLDRSAKIISDVMDYHASTDSLIELGADIDTGMIAFYHLVPAPANLIMSKIFERNLPENFVLANDGDWFELPSDSSAIIHTSN